MAEVIHHDLDTFRSCPWANATTNPPPDVCSVCSDVIRDDSTATDGRGERIHDDCATCDCCGNTLGTCRIVCDMADNDREGK